MNTDIINRKSLNIGSKALYISDTNVVSTKCNRFPLCEFVDRSPSRVSEIWRVVTRGTVFRYCNARSASSTGRAPGRQGQEVEVRGLGVQCVRQLM